MTLEQDRVNKLTDTIRGLTDQLVNLTGGRIDQANETLNVSIHTFQRITSLRVARVDASLMAPLAMIYHNATFHTVKAYFHASPGLLALLSTIWTIIEFAWKIAKYVIQIVQIIQELRIDDLLARFCPAFDEARKKFRLWVANVSDALGWGADGLLHLIHAAGGFTDILGGLTGKDYAWMDTQFMIKSGNVLEKIKGFGMFAKDNPGQILDFIFHEEMHANLKITSKFGREIRMKFRNLSDWSKQTLVSLSDVSDELAAIQEGMPDVIRENIPAGIFDSLERFSDIIDTEIMPRFAAVERYVAILDSVLASQNEHIGNLAEKLAHPGTNLLTIDDLPDYAREQEQWAIDDVSSRLFGEQVDADRAAMEGDLAAFAIIDAAATSPLPELEFMTIEEPGRASLHGITATPQETWFIGGYKTQL